MALVKDRTTENVDRVYICLSCYIQRLHLSPSRRFILIPYPVRLYQRTLWHTNLYRKHTRKRTHAHTHIRTHTHTYIYIHGRSHTYTHTPSTNTPSSHFAQKGERPFPPPTSLSFSTWLCVDRFSNPLEDPHPIRLLTMARIVTTPSPEPTAPDAGGGGSGGAGATITLPAAPNMIEAHTLCLTVELAARDRALIVSTVERTYDFLSAAKHAPGKTEGSLYLGTQNGC